MNDFPFLRCCDFFCLFLFSVFGVGYECLVGSACLSKLLLSKFALIQPVSHATGSWKWRPRDFVPFGWEEQQQQQQTVNMWNKLKGRTNDSTARAFRWNRDEVYNSLSEHLAFTWPHQITNTHSILFCVAFCRRRRWLFLSCREETHIVRRAILRFARATSNDCASFESFAFLSFSAFLILTQMCVDVFVSLRFSKMHGAHLRQDHCVQTWELCLTIRAQSKNVYKYRIDDYAVARLLKCKRKQKCAKHRWKCVASVRSDSIIMRWLRCASNFSMYN